MVNTHRVKQQTFTFSSNKANDQNKSMSQRLFVTTRCTWHSQKTIELLNKRTSGGCNIQPCSYLHLTRHLYFKCSIISSLVELCFEGPKGCQQAVSISLSLSIEVSLSFNPVLILNSIPYNKVNIPFLYLKLSCASFSTKLIVIYLGLAPLGKAAPYRANATPFW